MKKVILCLKFLIFFVGMTFGTSHIFGKEYKIGFTQHVSQLVAAKVLREIYQKAGLNSAINSYPGARLKSLIQTESLDGEVARIAEYYNQNKMLKKIETPIYYFDAWVYVHQNEKSRKRSVVEFKDSKIGILRGVLYGEILTNGFKHLVRTDSSRQLFDLLSLGRLDAVIDTDFMRLAYVSKFNEKKIRPEFFIKRYYFYHGLRKKLLSEHEKISKIMSELSKSGELQKIIHRAEKDVLDLPTEHLFVVN